MPVLKTILIFVAAGLCEIGGGYLVWISVREGKSMWYALLGSAVLILYISKPISEEKLFTVLL